MNQVKLFQDTVYYDPSKAMPALNTTLEADINEWLKENNAALVSVSLTSIRIKPGLGRPGEETQPRFALVALVTYQSN